MIPPLERRLPAFIVQERIAAIRTLLGLGEDVPDPLWSGPLGAVCRLLTEARREDHWVIAAVLTASIPLSLFVDEVTRAVELRDLERAAKMLVIAWLPDDARDVSYLDVRVVSEGVLIDVFGLDDDRAPRDSRRAARALVDDAPAEAIPVTWSEEYRSLVAVGGPANEVVVPYGGAYLLTGVCDEPPRAARLMSLAQSSSTVVTGIGYGLGPLTDVELFDDVEKPRVEPRRYSWHVATNRVMQRIVTVSDTAQHETVGWKAMLPALGVLGPELTAGRLGTDALRVAPGGLPPRLLVVGSNSTVGGFLTVRGALGLLTVETRPSEILRLEPADGTSIDFEVDGISTSPVVDLSTLRASDVVVSCGSSSSHDVLLESLVAAGIRTVAAESGFARELDEHYPACIVVPRRDAIATAAALESQLTAAAESTQAAAAPGRSWSDFTRLVWECVTASGAAGSASV